MNITPSSFANASPSLALTSRPSKSVLFPTNATTTSPPLSAFTSEIHFALFAKLERELTSYTITATLESRMYDGINDRNRSCPAVSHNCRRTVRSSRYIVFDKKSIPIVAWYELSNLSYMKREMMEVFPTD